MAHVLLHHELGHLVHGGCRIAPHDLPARELARRRLLRVPALGHRSHDARSEITPSTSCIDPTTRTPTWSPASSSATASSVASGGMVMTASAAWAERRPLHRWSAGARRCRSYQESSLAQPPRWPSGPVLPRPEVTLSGPKVPGHRPVARWRHDQGIRSPPTTWRASRRLLSTTTSTGAMWRSPRPSSGRPTPRRDALHARPAGRFGRGPAVG